MKYLRRWGCNNNRQKEMDAHVPSFEPCTHTSVSPIGNSPLGFSKVTVKLALPHEFCSRPLFHLFNPCYYFKPSTHIRMYLSKVTSFASQRLNIKQLPVEADMMAFLWQHLNVCLIASLKTHVMLISRHSLVKHVTVVKFFSIFSIFVQTTVCCCPTLFCLLVLYYLF